MDGADSGELPPAWLERQLSMAAQVVIPGAEPIPRCPRTLALDIQYADDVAHVGAAWSDDQGERVFTARAAAPVGYVPGAFCFREGPPLVALIAAIATLGLQPELVLVDGHGLAHPRRAGAACWVGVETGLPTLGCAKQTLLPYVGSLGPERGARLPVFLGGEQVGFVLRTRDQVKPMFVSPGHRIGIEQAAERVLALPGSYRVPDPLRTADYAARRCAQGLSEPGWTDLGTLRSPSVA